MKQVNFKKILLPIILSGLILSACEKAPLPVDGDSKSVLTQGNNASPKTLTVASKEAIPEIVIDTGSPDSALKSWWRVLDLREKIDKERCNQEVSKEKPGYVLYFPKVAQEDVLKTFIPKDTPCFEDIYERDIQEVKTESETRAIAFVVIKNIAPIPLGAEPDEYDKQYRKDGFRFKYLLEKTSEGWKVSQVYKYDELNVKYFKKDPWVKIYKVDDKPRYPAFVFSQ